MDTVAVIGGSNGGYAAAAEYADAGYAVQWYVRTPAHHEAVLASGAVTRRVSEHYPGERRTPGERTEVQVDNVTTVLRAAVSGADLVVVPLPTTAQRALFDELADHLEGDQVVILSPGNFGSFLLWQALEGQHDEAESRPDVIIAETPTLPFVTRRSGEAEVTINLDAVALPVGAFPGRDSERAAAAFTPLHEGVRPVKDALDAALTNSNPCVNAVPTVMNAGAIECAELERFNIHRHGIGPGVYNVLMAVDRERIGLREALGYGPPHFRQDEYYRPEAATTGEHFYGAEARAALTAAETFSQDPPSLDDRYVHEDVGIATVLWASLGDYLDVPSPTIDAVVQLAERMMDERFRETGRSLERLGIAELDRPSFEGLLTEGAT